MKSFVYRLAATKHWKVFGVFFLIAAGCLIYSNTLRSSFQFDDIPAIAENYQIYNVWNPSEIWRFYKQRFIGFYTFAANYHFHGLNVFGYHVVNTIIHIGTALWVWYLVSLTLRFHQFQEKFSPEQKKWLAFLTALLFLAHPIATQSVTYIYQRVTSLAVFFCLASLCFYIKGRTAQKGYFLPATAAAVAAVFTKEFSFILFFLILLYETYFLGQHKKLRWRWYYLIPAVLFLLIVPALYKFDLAERFFKPRVAEGQYEIIITIPSYMLTQFRIFLLSLQLLIFPYNQNLDHEIPLAKSFWEPVTFISFLLVMLILIVAVRLRKKDAFVSFGVLWIFLTFCYNFIPRDDIFDEHKLYFPAVGYCIALCFGFYRIVQDFPKFVKVTLAIAVVLGFTAFYRNTVWQNPLTLWSDVIKKSPHKARAYNAVGRYYMEHGQKDLAVVYFNKALSLRPGYLRPYINRGIIYFEKGFDDLALADFKKALEINPKSVQTYNNIGQVLAAKGEYALALESFSEALLYQVDYLFAFYSRGQLYETMGEYQKAIDDYTQALFYNPRSDTAYMMRGQVYYKLRNLDLALQDFNKALAINPKLAGLYNNRGNIYMSRGQTQLALNDFTSAIKADPGFAMAYNNRGLVFKNAKDYNSALSDFNQAIALDPAYVPVYINRSVLFIDFKQYELALADINKALSMDAGSAEAYNNRGLIFRATNQPDKALADFDKAAALNPRFPQIYFNKADIYILQQQYGLALAEYDKVLGINPRSAEAFYLKSLVYEKMGDFDQAFKEKEKARALGWPS